jgi:mono/diheme cytochrome c family protein
LRYNFGMERFSKIDPYFSRSRPALRLTIKTLFPYLFALAVLMGTLDVCGATPGSEGWYTSPQAAAGAKAYKKTCASCHGATLQGGMGPALVGKPFWQAYGGKKVSSLWSSVHTQMPMMAPNSVPARNSVNIMAFLLQKNGVPAGATPLDDTVDLSKVLPSK